MTAGVAVVVAVTVKAASVMIVSLVKVGAVGGHDRVFDRDRDHV